MKNFFCLLPIIAILTTSSAFAEPIQTSLPQKKNIKKENLKQSTSSKIRVVPYAQVIGIFPGAGLLIRVHNDTFGFQVDYMTGGIPPDVLFSGVAIAPVLFPYSKEKSENQGTFNLGGGIGIYNTGSILFTTPEFLYFPLFVGYQKNSIFFEANMNIIIVKIFQKEGILPLPGIKLGFSF